MSEVTKLIETAISLNSLLDSERDRCAAKAQELTKNQTACGDRARILDSRESAVSAREQTVEKIESANLVLAQAQEVKRENQDIQKQIDVRILQAKAAIKSAKESLEKLEREQFDFNEAKRAHTITRREFEEQKAEWQEKVDKLGINV